MMVVQPCENTLDHRVAHFKIVNFMVIELYLKKNVIRD